jgi:hypothetical protein
MDIYIDQLILFLKKIEPLLIVAVGVWIKIQFTIRKKKDELSRKAIAQAKTTYKRWAHQESKSVVLKITELCNLYKDRSKAYEVLFLQFENGTVATNNLYNMCISALAEDNRYGPIPKKCANLQKIPYCDLVDWAELLTSGEESRLAVSDIPIVRPEWGSKYLFHNVKSHLAHTVHDKDGYPIGIAVFSYHSIRFNGLEEHGQINIIEKFKTAIETVFLGYHISSRDKKLQLQIPEDEHE